MIRMLFLISNNFFWILDGNPGSLRGLAACGIEADTTKVVNLFQKNRFQRQVFLWFHSSMTKTRRGLGLFATRDFDEDPGMGFSGRFRWKWGKTLRGVNL